MLVVNLLTIFNCEYYKYYIFCSETFRTNKGLIQRKESILEITMTKAKVLGHDQLINVEYKQTDNMDIEQLTSFK